MKKYYYFDDKGNKKYYVGKIINDYITGETYGLLTNQNIENKEIELEYHPEIQAENGWSSYFTYINNDGIKTIYNGLKYNIKTNYIDNSYFFVQTNTDKVNLIKHEKVEYKPGYYTYIDSFGKENLYDGKVFYDKFTSTYYFYK